MNWLRLHHSMLDSVKVQSLSPGQFKAWVNLMVIASENTPRGTLPSIKQIAFRLHLRPDQTASNVDALVMQGLIERSEGGYQMHDWHDWQKESDDVAQRVKKWRDSKCNVTRNVTETVQIEREIEIREDNTKPSVVSLPVATKQPAKLEPKKVNLEDVLNELQGQDAFKHLDVRSEYSRCAAWCVSNNQPQPSKKRLTNWLLRAEAPIPNQPASTGLMILGNRARAPVLSKSEKGLMDFRRRMASDMEELQKNG